MSKYKIQDNSPVLVCFDFDQTIVKGHFHSELNDQHFTHISSENGETVLGVVTDDKPSTEKAIPTKYTEETDRRQAATKKLLEDPTKGLKNPKELKQTFETLLKDGHKIAITSFNQYPDAIKVTLEKLGLSDEQIKDIHIISGFPSGGSDDPTGKQQHIDAALSAHGMQAGNYSKVLLVDDSKPNRNAAEDIGISTVRVPEEASARPEYLKEVITKATALKAPHLEKSVSKANTNRKTPPYSSLTAAADPIVDNTNSAHPKGGSHQPERDLYIILPPPKEGRRPKVDTAVPKNISTNASPLPPSGPPGLPPGTTSAPVQQIGTSTVEKTEPSPTNWERFKQWVSKKLVSIGWQKKEEAPLPEPNKEYWSKKEVKKGEGPIKPSSHSGKVKKQEKQRGFEK